jgi:transposase
VGLLESIGRPRRVIFEEGGMAEWLYRNLRPYAEAVTSCEPRRNHWISREGEKDDPLDAEKLAQLDRGGYVKPVYHPESEERSLLKQLVSLYHDRVRHRVRVVNRIAAQFRSHGVVVTETDFATPQRREVIQRSLPKHPWMANSLKWLWEHYEMLVHQEEEMQRELQRIGRKEDVLRRFVQVPGIGWIWAATFYAYIDTPWRFRRKESLWKYMGIGLERRHSGNGPVQWRLAKAANRRLKYMILSAARSAVNSLDGPFAARYHRGIRGGLSSRCAFRNVARQLSAALWGMWKSGAPYHADLVGHGAFKECGSGCNESKAFTACGGVPKNDMSPVFGSAVPSN